MKKGESTPAMPALVLDTNAALDWLLFRDAGIDAVRAAIESGAVRWVASPRMRDDLFRALSFPSLARWLPNSEHTLAIFDHWVCLCAEPEATRTGPLICSDADDQVFMDLALAQRARWLITHDRALHKLSRRAALAGVDILRPRDWLGAQKKGAAVAAPYQAPR